MVLTRSIARSLLLADASAAVPAPEPVAAPAPVPVAEEDPPEEDPEELVQVEDLTEEDDEEIHLKLEMHLLRPHKLDMEDHLDLEQYHHRHCRLSQRRGP